MNYLYHMVPEDMKGRDLMPLNRLKKKYPKTYLAEAKKYLGRKNVMEKRIPLLDCKWNDVLHLTAVHPRKLKRALRKAGGDKSKISSRWFKIKPSQLDKDNAIINIYTDKKELFLPFDHKGLRSAQHIPLATQRYYHKSYKEHTRPLLFAYINHILYKGTLPFKELEIIEV